MCASSKQIFVSAVLPELVGKFFSKVATKYNRSPLTPVDSNITADSGNKPVDKKLTVN
ncbi:hypothetical protein DPMN_056183 [Dreissena polymorpha]|uniref:Uncharacterized protein n=1 Tax=Dreissena polymorpha TaxID=45954 RepID=A0A9D4CS28_DREPO|nr:hypothetical protein DPMN_056183 [Dreissena polymorpha]